MKLSLVTIVIASFLFSCEEQNGAGEKTNVLADSGRVANQVDSLQLDTSTFITTNFPDTVHRVLYNETDTLWNYVHTSVKSRDKKHDTISFYILLQLLTNAGFVIDGSETGSFASKSDFNKRYAVEWHRGHTDTITTQVQYWYKSRKYILVNTRTY